MPNLPSRPEPRAAYFRRVIARLLPIFTLITVLTAIDAHAQNKTATQLQAMFQARSFTSSQITMVYRLYVPTGYDSTMKYPVVVALHGVGERGNNNVNQLTLEELAQPWVRDSVQAKHPHFVMVPQCPSTNSQYWWPWGSWAGTWSGMWSGTRSNANTGIISILDSLKREFSLDTTRFYVAGLSMGGFGTFELMKWNPNVFAAAVPAAGGADTAPASIQNYSATPFWAFHGAADPTINVNAGSRKIVNKVETLRGKPFVRFVSSASLATPTAISADSLRKEVYVSHADFLYSEITGGVHNSGWLEAWRHPMLTDWVFSKQKINGVTVSVNPGSVERSPLKAKAQLELHNGMLALRKSDQGGDMWYTLAGKKMGLFEKAQNRP